MERLLIDKPNELVHCPSCEGVAFKDSGQRIFVDGQNFLDERVVYACAACSHLVVWVAARWLDAAPLASEPEGRGIGA